MPAPITYTELALFDDLLVDCLIDRLFYWATVRKMREYKPIRGIPLEDICAVVKEELINTSKPSLSNAVERFSEFKSVQIFLRRFQDPGVRIEFDRHIKRYMQIYLKECGFGIEVTDRYRSRSKADEACVVARKQFEAGEEIKGLSGYLVELDEDEEDELNQGNDKDFSIINSSRRGRNCLMLGPARFVNHDCEANARFVTSGMNMYIHAMSRIHVGQEISVKYSENYFGRRNRECLCVTCEQLHRNGFASSVESSSEEESDDGSPRPKKSFSKESQRLQTKDISGIRDTLLASASPASAASDLDRYASPLATASLNGSPVAPEFPSNNKLKLNLDTLAPVLNPRFPSYDSAESSPQLFSPNSNSLSPQSSLEPDPELDAELESPRHEKRSLRPKRSYVNYKKVKKVDAVTSRDAILRRCHEYQRLFYAEPFTADGPKVKKLECRNCLTPFIKREEEKLVLRKMLRNYCPRCHRQIELYNAFWPSVRAEEEPIELYRPLYLEPESNDESESESESDSESDSESETEVRTLRRKANRRVFAPAVSDVPEKNKSPRRVSVWLKQRRSGGRSTRKATSAPPVKKRKYTRRLPLPAESPQRQSRRLHKPDEEVRSSPRMRKPSRKLLDSM